VLARTGATLLGLALLPVAIWLSLPTAGITNVAAILLLRAVTPQDLEPLRSRLPLRLR
jgi:hypothetical protein